ncbi:MAG TPA: hypothetical protein VK806_04170 [Bacteroidia bacterium]|jgi:hypothetical protein|nr:hypothetical protein [Bacteroidia bacterium]
MISSPLLKIVFAFTFFLLLCTNCIGQKIIIKYDTTELSLSGWDADDWYIKNRPDSTFITFDAGFNNQPVEIDINDQKYTVAYFVTSAVLGRAGTVKIPKINGDEKISIKINSIPYGNFILSKKYCSIHFDYNIDSKDLLVTYTNHVYLYE